MPTKLIPLFGQANTRATGTGDRRFVNVLFEMVANDTTKEVEVYCVKRPGLANSTQPPAGSATGRGCYAWGANGNIYSVFANKVYSGTTDLGVTLAGSSGRVWWWETPAGAATRYLMMSDGSDLYLIETNDTITQIDENDDAQFPTSNLGPVLLLDGYVVLAQSDGDVWNFDLNSFTAVSADAFLRANRHGDNLEAIHLVRDQIIAFGKNSIEFYFNAGNASGSPFTRVEQNALDFGIASKATLAWSGPNVMFVGENTARGDGARSVWLISGLSSIKEVSNPRINRFLSAEGSSISSATAWMEKVAGQVVYVLNLSSANRTFVYSLENGEWVEWEAAGGGGKFPGVSATSLNGTVYVQDASNGRVYTLLPSTYQDSGVNFTSTIQLERSAYGTNKRKTIQRVSLIGDVGTSPWLLDENDDQILDENGVPTSVEGGTTLQFSDDDYSTWTTAGIFDRSTMNPKIHRCKSFVGGRAWRITDGASDDFRIQALEIDYDYGNH